MTTEEIVLVAFAFVFLSPFAWMILDYIRWRLLS